MKSKVSRRKELIKMRKEINKTEAKIIRAMKPGTGFLKKINKIDKMLTRFTKKRAQLNKTRNEKGEITTKIQRPFLTKLSSKLV